MAVSRPTLTVNMRGDAYDGSWPETEAPGAAGRVTGSVGGRRGRRREEYRDNAHDRSAFSSDAGTYL